MKHTQRWWKDGVLIREAVNGVDVPDNIGRTSQDLGVGIVRVENRKAIPRSKWPIWARALRQFSNPEDKGIGDVVLRIIGNENSESFKAWHQKLFGNPCNCNGRLKRWNALYPLP